jgi:hypothetical protein
MGVTSTGTRVDEVGEGIYRISTPVAAIPGGFSFMHAFECLAR